MMPVNHIQFHSEKQAKIWKRNHKRFGWFISEPWFDEYNTHKWCLTVQK